MITVSRPHSKFIPSTDRNKWEEARMINCALGGNAASAQANIDACLHHFKNEAFEADADLVLVKPEDKRVGVDTAIDRFTGKAINCANCVDMKGIILKPKAEAKAPLTATPDEIKALDASS